MKKLLCAATGLLLLSAVLLSCAPPSSDAFDSSISTASVEASDKLADNTLTIMQGTGYSDKETTVFLLEQPGVSELQTATKIEAPEYAETTLPYRVDGGVPYEFYVIRVWVKTVAFSTQEKDDTGIAIMVHDASDYNSDSVYSEMIKGDTETLAGHKNGWFPLKRVVKLDATGGLSFVVRGGWRKNKSKGIIIIDAVDVVPLAEDDSFIMLASDDKKIRMVFRTGDIIASGQDKENLRNWVNVYAQLRASMKWLVGDREPYEGTTDYICTESLSHYGLAGNPIYINANNFKNDLRQIELDTTQENNDVLWGFAHEMSHTFDGAGSQTMDMRWVFDAEFFAELKCVYSLYDNGFGMGGDFFTGDRILSHFADTPALSTGLYSNEGFMIHLLKSVDNPNGTGAWESLRKTFQYFNELPHSAVPETNVEKFQLFMQILSEKSGIDVQSNFTRQEWDLLTAVFTN